MLSYTFQTMTLQDPSWNMDTRASSHLADNTDILTSFSNSSMYPSVFVGNGYFIPVSHTGHSFLHTSSKPLHLNHILVTPYIIKNLISVRQFTRDNDVSVEFDAYGFRNSRKEREKKKEKRKNGAETIKMNRGHVLLASDSQVRCRKEDKHPNPLFLPSALNTSRQNESRLEESVIKSSVLTNRLWELNENSRSVVTVNTVAVT
ncbi:hypothetical protein Tco_0278155 [Tanacetum coccineum]